MTKEERYSLPIEVPRELRVMTGFTYVLLEELYKEIAILHGAPGPWIDELEQKLLAHLTPKSGQEVPTEIDKPLEILRGLVMMASSRIANAEGWPGQGNTATGDSD